MRAASNKLMTAVDEWCVARAAIYRLFARSCSFSRRKCRLCAPTNEYIVCITYITNNSAQSNAAAIGNISAATSAFFLYTRKNDEQDEEQGEEESVLPDRIAALPFKSRSRCVSLACTAFDARRRERHIVSEDAKKRPHAGTEREEWQWKIRRANRSLL